MHILLCCGDIIVAEDLFDGMDGHISHRHLGRSTMTEAMAGDRRPLWSIRLYCHTDCIRRDWLLIHCTLVTMDDDEIFTLYGSILDIALDQLHERVADTERSQLATFTDDLNKSISMHELLGTE